MSWWPAAGSTRTAACGADRPDCTMPTAIAPASVNTAAPIHIARLRCGIEGSTLLQNVAAAMPRLDLCQPARSPMALMVICLSKVEACHADEFFPSHYRRQIRAHSGDAAHLGQSVPAAVPGRHDPDRPLHPLGRHGDCLHSACQMTRGQ